MAHFRRQSRSLWLRSTYIYQSCGSLVLGSLVLVEPQQRFGWAHPVGSPGLGGASAGAGWGTTPTFPNPNLQTKIGRQLYGLEGPGALEPAAISKDLPAKARSRTTLERDRA